MSGKLTNSETKGALNSIGMWMESRYSDQDVEAPIQTWDMPPKEKEFFTVYAMNLVLESDGFGCLVGQKAEDVAAFINLLHQFGAKKTSDLVQSTLAALKSKSPCDERECTRKYYELFERDTVWLKLMDHLGQRIYKSYLSKAEAIDAAGQSIFDVKQWQGDLPLVVE